MKNLWFRGWAGGARDEPLAQTENKTPKQNAFKPGRWVGLDPFAPGHNKTIKKGHQLKSTRESTRSED